MKPINQYFNIQDLFSIDLHSIDHLLEAENDIFGFEDNELLDLIVLGDYLFDNKLMLSPELYKWHTYIVSTAPISKQEIQIYKSLLLTELFYITKINTKEK